MSIGTILIIILFVALLGGFTNFGSSWGSRAGQPFDGAQPSRPFYGTGYGGGGLLGLVLVVVLILVLLRKI